MGELLRIVGASNSAHIFGTLVPVVEEPSTASIGDITAFFRCGSAGAMHGNLLL